MSVKSSESRYEVHGFGSDVYVDTLKAARLIARRKARINRDRGVSSFILIYQVCKPYCPGSKTVLVEKWRMNKYGDYEQNKIVR